MIAVVAIVVVVASYLTWMARLDRLAVRVEAAVSALDAQLARRAVVAYELSEDPAFASRYTPPPALRWTAPPTAAPSKVRSPVSCGRLPRWPVWRSWRSSDLNCEKVQPAALASVGELRDVGRLVALAAPAAGQRDDRDRRDDGQAQHHAAADLQRALAGGGLAGRLLLRDALLAAAFLLLGSMGHGRSGSLGDAARARRTAAAAGPPAGVEEVADLAGQPLRAERSSRIELACTRRALGSSATSASESLKGWTGSRAWPMTRAGAAILRAHASCAAPCGRRTARAARRRSARGPGGWCPGRRRPAAGRRRWGPSARRARRGA